MDLSRRIRRSGAESIQLYTSLGSRGRIQLTSWVLYSFKNPTKIIGLKVNPGRLSGKITSANYGRQVYCVKIEEYILACNLLVEENTPVVMVLDCYKEKHAEVVCPDF